MGLGNCGLYVPAFGKKRSSVGIDDPLSPRRLGKSSHQRSVSDGYVPCPPDSIIPSSEESSKSSSDRNLVMEKKTFRHQRSFSQGNTYKSPSPRHNSIPGKSTCDTNQAVKHAIQADRNLVTQKKYAHQRSFSQGNNIPDSPRNNLVTGRASDANQAAKQGSGPVRYPHYGHGNIIKNPAGNCGIPKPQNPGGVEELNHLGNLKYRKGEFLEAIRLYDKAIALCPQGAAIYTNKSAALFSLGRLTEAVEECLKAIRCDPSCSAAHHRLGTIYTRFGQVDDARWHFKLSGKNIGSDIMNRLLLIEAHYMNTKKARKNKDWVGVLRESTQCIEAGVDASNQLVALKAEALLKLQRADEAFEIVNAATHSEESRVRKPSKGTACLLIIEAKLNLYLGRFDKGVKSAEKAVDMDSNRKSLKWLKKARGAADARKSGNELYKDGKYLEACTMYSQGLECVPTNSVLLCYRAACRSKLGQWEIAIDDCNAAIRERPNYHKAFVWRAHSYAKLRRWEDSFKDYSVLSKEFPGDEFITSSLAQVQLEMRAQAGGRFSILNPIAEESSTS